MLKPVKTAPEEGVLHQTAETETVAAPPPTAPGVMDRVSMVWDDLSHLLQDQFKLVTLETQRAARSLVAMLIWGLVAGLLLVTAWMGIMAAIVLFLVDLGLAASLSILLVVVLTLVAAGICALIVRKKSQYLRYPATMRSLRSRKQSSGQQEES